MEQQVAGLWCKKRPPAIEQIARIEGQSTFIALLRGEVAGADQTSIMGRLGFSRSQGAIPEVLEAYVCPSKRWTVPLMALMWRELNAERPIKPEDAAWVRDAIANAYLLVMRGHCKSRAKRAEHFRMREQTYGTMRKRAVDLLSGWLNHATCAWRDS